MYEKLKKIAFPLYVIFLMLGFFYVKSVLNKEEIKVIEKKSEKVQKDKKPVVAYLNVSYLDGTRTYRARLENVDSILDFFEYLHSKDDFSFTKEMHSFGITYPSINGVSAPDGYKWRIFLGDSDITDMSHRIFLDSDEQTYDLKLIRIEELQ